MNVIFVDEEHSWKTETLTEFLSENPPPESWQEIFDKNAEEIQKISSIIEARVKEGAIVYPPPNRVFRAFYVTPFFGVRLVILGMDPYHDGNAVGLCFSVPPNGKINPSLRNIYKELENCGYIPKKDGNLLPWAKQGCLMLNASMTVEKGCAGEHSEHWHTFTQNLVSFLCKRENLSWLLMGADALYYREIIVKLSPRANIFATSHPSPFSAYKPLREYPAFLGSKVFQKINEKMNPKIVW